MLLIVNEHADVIGFCKAFNKMAFVLPNSLREIAGYTNVERSISLAYEHVDCGGFHDKSF